MKNIRHLYKNYYGYQGAIPHKDRKKERESWRQKDREGQRETGRRIRRKRGKVRYTTQWEQIHSRSIYWSYKTHTSICYSIYSIS